MIKQLKVALSAATTALAIVGLTVAPQASADELSNLKARISKLEKAKAETSAKSNGNMVFFRGGYARNDTARYGEILTDTAGGLGLAPQANGSQDGWYFGAGFDFNLSDDLFGLHDGTEILAELMFEYKEFDRQTQALNPLITVVNTAVNNTPTGGLGSVTVSQFTLTASPKVKFLKGSKFRPWIIPAGFALHVISPPSDGVTVLEPGMHFAAGADYNLWKDFYIGADFRYNLTIGKTLDGTNVSGFTTGGYLGIGF